MLLSQRLRVSSVDDDDNEEYNTDVQYISYYYFRMQQGPVRSTGPARLGSYSASLLLEPC